MRRRLDRYFTGTDTVNALLNTVNIDGKILEPCAGDGSISNVLKMKGHKVYTNDISPMIITEYKEDARENYIWQVEIWNWIVSNPPFRYAYDILKQSLKLNIPIAFLLRLSFLEPTYDRQELLSKQPPSALIILPRYSFTGDGKTDSVTCAWMIWNFNLSPSIRIIKK